jgi:hypothetical protein
LAIKTSVAELTEAMITAAMAKADARVCVGRIAAMPFHIGPRIPARPACRRAADPVGWIVSQGGGRESWDVWLAVSTGLVKLIRRANA